MKKVLAGEKVEGLPGPLQEAEKRVFVDAVCAECSSSGHGDNIGKIAKIVAEKYPDQARKLSSLLWYLRECALRNYQSQGNAQSLKYADWLQKAASDVASLMDRTTT
jgi:hypothetical protein